MQIIGIAMATDAGTCSSEWYKMLFSYNGFKLISLLWSVLEHLSLNLEEITSRQTFLA